jgi:hypothetical protein
LVNGKNSEDFFYFLHCFSTDQSEAKLLYFYSLFFSVKKPFQKTKIFAVAKAKVFSHLEAMCPCRTGITACERLQKAKIGYIIPKKYYFV